jgi:Tol biopolymer transport system component
MRLYFEEAVGGSWKIAQVSVNGGDTVAVPTPFPNPGVLDISPNGSDLLFVSFAGSETVYPLWDFPLLGGAPRRITNVLVTDATWYPDGQRITYSVGPDLYSARPDGSESHRIAHLPNGVVAYPRWSPNGRILRFTVYDSTNFSMSLWEVSTDGNLRPLLPGWNNPPAECCGNWTRDGKYFVFESTLSGKTDIWVMRDSTDGLLRRSREPVQLTLGSINYWAPVPSKDGKKVFVLGTLQRGELSRFDNRSGHFVPYLGGISAEDASFSKDGQWVAYVKYPEGVLWRSQIDGRGRQQLSFPPLQTAHPRWAPDGKRITFQGRLPGKPQKIYLIPAEGGIPELLLSGESQESDPDWSPDGSSVVFGGLSAQLSGTTASNAVRRIDLKRQQVATLPGSEGMYRPRWSSDGKNIVAQTLDSQKLMLFSVGTQKWTELATMGVGYANWSADGKHVYFDNPFGSDPAFYRVRISDRKLERIVSLKDIRRASFALQPWSGLAPDDSPLLLQDAGSQEIYALDVQLP